MIANAIDALAKPTVARRVPVHKKLIIDKKNKWLG